MPAKLSRNAGKHRVAIPAVLFAAIIAGSEPGLEHSAICPSGGRMIKNETGKKSRKPYDKPLLRVVSISSGTQTLGIGCKIAGSVMPGALQPTSCGIANGCAQNGS
jgi:hypothetical protein